MFGLVKKFFTKNQNTILQPALTSIKFLDLKQQNIIIDVKPNGHDTILTLTETKTNTEITLDKEKCIILSAILSEYYNTGEFSRMSKIFEGEN